MHALSVWIGPCNVREYANRMREAGIEVSCEGTERIFVNVDGTDAAGAAWNALAMLVQKHGSDFGLRFRKV